MTDMLEAYGIGIGKKKGGGGGGGGGKKVVAGKQEPRTPAGKSSLLGKAINQ